MSTDPDVSTFLDFAAGAMNVNGLIKNWEAEFVDEIKNLRTESLKDSFRRGFAKSLCGQLTPKEFETATDWDFDTPEEFQDHLKGLWTRFYGDADPAESLTWPQPST